MLRSSRVGVEVFISRTLSGMEHRKHLFILLRWTSGYLRAGMRFLLLPAVFYFCGFAILTWPLLPRFSTHFFADTGDGFQNVWNLWWVNKSLTQLHQSPWHTTFLHFPYGTSLLGHLLTPFNGLMAILLLPLIPLVEAHNVIVIFAFVSSGITALWLSYYLTRSYPSSLIAGAIFTFSNYHFMHAQGHLQLVSFEWLPLFVFAWYLLMTKPSVWVGVVTGVVLFAVILCDYYAAFDSILAAGLITVWYAIRERDVRFLFRRSHRLAVVSFAIVFSFTTAPLCIALLRANASDPMGGHPSDIFSADLLSPFIPGTHWRFAQLTHPFWSRLPGDINETSVHVGLAVISLLVFTWWRRRRLASSPALWYAMLLSFYILSLGPVLHVFGRPFSFVKLPYHLLEIVFPPVNVSGVPIRMMVMVQLSAAVISAFGFEMLFKRPGVMRWFAVTLLLVTSVEYLPAPLPSTFAAVPSYVEFVKMLPDEHGLLDLADDGYAALYYQTVHEKQLAFGFTSRTPTSVQQHDQQLISTIQRGEWQEVYCQYHIRYVIADDSAAQQPHPAGQTIYDAGHIKVYDLEPSNVCSTH